MTCIDAAIIKALVEHIGGNPDEVPIGGGGSTEAVNKLLQTYSLSEGKGFVEAFNLKKAHQSEVALHYGSWYQDPDVVGRNDVALFSNPIDAARKELYDALKTLVKSKRMVVMALRDTKTNEIYNELLYIPTNDDEVWFANEYGTYKYKVDEDDTVWFGCYVPLLSSPPSDDCAAADIYYEDDEKTPSVLERYLNIITRYPSPPKEIMA